MNAYTRYHCWLVLKTEGGKMQTVVAQVEKEEPQKFKYVKQRKKIASKIRAKTESQRFSSVSLEYKTLLYLIKS